MRVVYAVLADSAVDSGNGKTDVSGMGFDHIYSTATPARHGQLVLVLRLEASLPECGQEHHIRIELWGPDGERLVQGAGSVIPQRNAVEPHQPSGQTLILNFRGLVFPAYGDYGFHILVDNLELGTVPFYVREAATPAREEPADGDQ